VLKNEPYVTDTTVTHLMIKRDEINRQEALGSLRRLHVPGRL